MIIPAHIQSLIVSGDIVSVLEPPSQEVVGFADYIEQNLPWIMPVQDSIDWTQLHGTLSVDISKLDENKLKEFLLNTTVSNYEFVTALTGPRRPAFVFTWQSFYLNFDRATSVYGHLVYMVATRKTGQTFSLEFRDFLEFELDEGMLLSGFQKLET
jgi:hypothetical protein